MRLNWGSRWAALPAPRPRAPPGSLLGLGFMQQLAQLCCHNFIILQHRSVRHGGRLILRLRRLSCHCRRRADRRFQRRSPLKGASRSSASSLVRRCCIRTSADVGTALTAAVPTTSSARLARHGVIFVCLCPHRRRTYVVGGWMDTTGLCRLGQRWLSDPTEKRSAFLLWSQDFKISSALPTVCFNYVYIRDLPVLCLLQNQYCACYKSSDQPAISGFCATPLWKRLRNSSITFRRGPHRPTARRAHSLAHRSGRCWLAASVHSRPRGVARSEYCDTSHPCASCDDFGRTKRNLLSHYATRLRRCPTS